MDDTQQSRVSDAATTRKRRSSILKSQRPARTPFSELEFNVATPTDTAKSRRVSFSRRTGVAEFVTNDATTTWKNFYEEHNKSLESSNNDSGANASRHPVEHLGKRIFDQQFEEIEAVDFISTLNPSSSINGSINNVNFTQQLASFDCTSDGKIPAPQNKFDLSALTDQQSKLFGNDFTIPTNCEMSGRIDINFSALQQLGEKDDLDEIQKDLARVSNNIVCHGGTFNDRQNMSEYIEVDLNMTNVALRNDDDMSITDTVHSPVQDVSKSTSIDKKVSLNTDWAMDKENIVVNPYAAPRESVNFAINEEPEQILVFDGKRLTLQPDKPEKDKNYRQTLLPNSSTETPQRKTIVLNVNDDLPNFAEDTLNSKSENACISGVQDLKSDYYYNDDEVSTTLPVNRVDIVPKKKIILETTGNISMTQALPTNILTDNVEINKGNSDRRRTIVFDEGAGNISVTQAISAKILTNSNKLPERRRTVVYEDNTGNISITQAIPTKIFVNKNFEVNEKRQTIVFDEDKGNISVTQAHSSNIIIDKSNEKRKTIVFDDDKGNISVTQALCSNILENKKPDKRNTIVFDDSNGNISITQALPASIVLPDRQLQEKRRTIIYEDDTGDISVTQALPNLILSQYNENSDRKRTVVYENDTGNISVTQALPTNILQNITDTCKDKSKSNESAIFPVTKSLPTNIILKTSHVNKRRTILYEDDTGNISITQAISTQLLPGYSQNNCELTSNASKNLNESSAAKDPELRTIVYDNDILATEPVDKLVSNEAKNKRKTILFDNNDADISMTQAIPTNVFLLDKLDSDIDQSKMQQEIEVAKQKVIDCNVFEPENPIEYLQEKRKTIVVHSEDCDVEMSITEAIPKVQNFIQESEKRKTIIYDNESGNISITKPIPAELLAYQNEILNKSRNKQFDLMEQDLVGNTCPDVFVYQAATTSSVPKLQSNRTDQGDLKSERPISSNTNSEAKVASSSKVTDDIESSMLDVRSENISLIHPRVVEKTEKWNLKDVDEKVADVMEIQTETAVTKEPINVEEPVESVLITATDYRTAEMPKSSVLNTTADHQIVETPKFSVLMTTTDAEVIETPKDSVLITTTYPQIIEMQKSISNTTTYPQIIKEPKDPMLNLTTDRQVIEKLKDSVLNTTTDPQLSETPKVSVLNSTADPQIIDEPKESMLNTTENPHIIVTSKESVLHLTENPQIIEKPKESVVHLTVDSQTVDKPKDSVLSKTTDPRIDDEPKELMLNTGTQSQNVEQPKDLVLNTEADPLFIEKPKESVLNDLLDMSAISLASGVEDKSFMAQIESDHSSAGTKPGTDAASNESMFYITKDSDEESQTDKEKKENPKSFGIPPMLLPPPLSMEYKEDEDSEAVTDLQTKIAEIKTAVSENQNSTINRFYEKIVSSNLEDVVEKDENVRLRKQSLQFQKANDTKELLEMISDFTDKNDDNDTEAVIMKVKGHTAENKTDKNEPKRLSFASNMQSNRQSIVLTREDLLNNISMAQAGLQKSRLNLDDSESMEEDTRDASMDNTFSKKSTRMSNEVVKTLHFDDESVSESSIKSETKISPLKKTAFGETSYMAEHKGKVIPSYLKDVSDGIKELMLDLVKPMGDSVPFDTPVIDKSFKKIPSTQSVQIQANLLTSSQVEIDSELYSNPESDVDRTNFVTGGALKKSKSHSKSPVKFSNDCSEKSSEFEVPNSKQRNVYSRLPPLQPPAERVLVFDHLNPLNNILLGTMDYTDAHRYNPKRSDETLCGDPESRSALIHHKTKDSEYELGNAATFRLESQVIHVMQGDVSAYKHDDQNSLLSNASKPISIDQSVEAKVSDFKDNEVNTLIAMKGNKELLEASSSLTLVDDAMAQQLDSELKISSDNTLDDESSGHHKLKVSRSPVKIIYKIEEQEAAMETDAKPDLTSQDEEMADVNKFYKGKKRIYIPSEKSARSPVDVTPKPNTKMQKMSNSPIVSREVLNSVSTDESTKMAAEKDVTDSTDKKDRASKDHDKKKALRKTKDKKPAANITVQQLITEYHVDAGVNQNILDKNILDAFNPKSDGSTAPASQSDGLEYNSLDVVSSFTSSKNLNTMNDVRSSSTTQSRQSQQSAALQSKNSSRLDWHPELISAMSSNLTESESAINVVAKIDMLPFMGSHECEWEPTSSADTWSFRLLHGRLRLSARLAHRHDNATRTRVRGDTPVLDVGVEIVQEDKKNPVATLCVRFACETMRYMVSRACRGPCYASDMPPLLRRCAAVARVALRWGRAMHDAKLHLAYTLDNSGHLTLKVANIPLRSVWEVSMRVELVVDDAREAPWPRAGNVRVARVVSDVSVSEQHVRRALAHTPRDWGHAPRTIWRIFRYLKHKTRDDDLLL